MVILLLTLANCHFYITAWGLRNHQPPAALCLTTGGRPPRVVCLPRGCILLTSSTSAKPASEQSGGTKRSTSELPLVRNPSGPARNSVDTKVRSVASREHLSDDFEEVFEPGNGPGPISRIFETACAERKAASDAVLHEMRQSAHDRVAFVANGRTDFGSNRRGGRMARKRYQRGKKGKKCGRGGALSSLPPSIQITPTHTHTYRYYNSTAATKISVTAANLIMAAGAICTVANTTITSMFTTVKIHSIKVWPAVASGDATVAVTWGLSNTDYAKDDVKNAEIPGGVTSTKSLIAHPPKNSLWREWINLKDPSVVVFTINSPQNSIVDVHCSWQMVNTYTSTTASVAAGVLGTTYYPALDGTGNHTYVPVTLPSTF